MHPQKVLIPAQTKSLILSISIQFSLTNKRCETMQTQASRFLSLSCLSLYSVTTAHLSTWFNSCFYCLYFSASFLTSLNVFISCLITITGVKIYLPQRQLLFEIYWNRNYYISQIHTEVNLNIMKFYMREFMISVLKMNF